MSNVDIIKTEIRCLKILNVTKRDRIRNDKVRAMAGVASILHYFQK